MAKYLVVGLQSYDFKDASGKQVKGSSVYFLDKSTDNGYKGYKVGKMAITEGFVSSFSTFPGLYDLEFSVKVGAGGKVNAILESVSFLSAVKFVDDKSVK